MDPNATLQEIRDLIAAIQGEPMADDIDEKASDLAELFQALDWWLSDGGFVPNAWRKKLQGSFQPR